MRLRRLLTTAAIVLCTGFPVRSFGAIADTEPAEFVRALGNEARGVIRADMAPAQKVNFFHQLLQQDFDLPGMARFVLGPYWRVASERVTPHTEGFAAVVWHLLVSHPKLQKAATKWESTK